jgi:hypothetical protein
MRTLSEYPAITGSDYGIQSMSLAAGRVPGRGTRRDIRASQPAGAAHPNTERVSPMACCCTSSRVGFFTAVLSACALIGLAALSGAGAKAEPVEGEACAQACADAKGECAGGACADGDAAHEHADAAAGVFKTVNTECPGSGKPVAAGITTLHAGFTVGFCCGGCQAKFDAQDDAQKTAYVAANAKAVNTACPGSGEPIVADVVSLHQGFAVGFCCGGCKTKWDAQSAGAKAAYVAQHAKAVNTECPGSGGAVKADIVAAYRGNVVAFCCDGCLMAWNTSWDAQKKDTFIATLAAHEGGCAEVCADEIAGADACEGACKGEA